VTALKTWWSARGTLTQLALIIAATVVVIEIAGLMLGGEVNSLQRRVPGSDKILHFCGFAALSLILSELLGRTSPGVRSPAVVVSLLLAVVAAADEAGQAFNPVRNVDLGDLAAGWCGLAIAGSWRLRRQAPALALAVGATALAIAGNVTMTSVMQQRHLNAAVRFERLGDFAGARREYLAALDAGAETAHVYNQLGWVEIESGIGDPSMALRYSEQALALRPNDPDIFDTYGWALHHVGRHVEALSYLERAYAAKPDIFCIHYHLGEVLVSLGQPDRAKFHFVQQMKLVNTNEAERARRSLERLEAGAGPAHRADSERLR
jgi:Tfp pilus assembly protein PilF/VanZ family protein